MEFKNMKIKDIDCVIKFVPQQNKFSCNNRPNHILGIQLSGSAMHYMEKSNVMLNGGTGYFFNQKDNYNVNVIEAGLAYSVHFTTYEPIETNSFFVRISNPTEIIKQLEIIDKTTCNGDELKQTAAFYTLSSLFNKIYEKKFFSGDLRIKNAEKYICEHFKEPNCISSAVNACNLSRRRFDDLFKSSFDVSPLRYLINLKIETAKNYLTASNAGISQIAELCGIDDIYYFSKLFKKETGYSPSEYRKNNRAEANS